MLRKIAGLVTAFLTAAARLIDFLQGKQQREAGRNEEKIEAHERAAEVRERARKVRLASNRANSANGNEKLRDDDGFKRD